VKEKSPENERPRRGQRIAAGRPCDCPWGFTQYIVIWSGDLPSEIRWYVARTENGWGYVAGILLFGNFVFPFLLLLFRFVKSSAVAMATIASALFALHYLDTSWVILPGLLPVRWWTVVLTIVMIIVVTGISAVFALRWPRTARLRYGRTSRSALLG
jgi:hypothetical protein